MSKFDYRTSPATGGVGWSTLPAWRADTKPAIPAEVELMAREESPLSYRNAHDQVAVNWRRRTL